MFKPKNSKLIIILFYVNNSVLKKLKLKFFLLNKYLEKFIRYLQLNKFLKNIVI